jgi:hypothetical protein
VAAGTLEAIKEELRPLVPVVRPPGLSAHLDRAALARTHLNLCQSGRLGRDCERRGASISGRSERVAAAVTRTLPAPKPVVTRIKSNRALVSPRRRPQFKLDPLLASGCLDGDVGTRSLEIQARTLIPQQQDAKLGGIGTRRRVVVLAAAASAQRYRGKHTNHAEADHIDFDGDWVGKFQRRAQMQDVPSRLRARAGSSTEADRCDLQRRHRGG